MWFPRRACTVDPNWHIFQTSRRKTARVQPPYPECFLFSPHALVTVTYINGSWIWHYSLLLFTLQDKSCLGAACSSCVAQWEVRPEAGSQRGACSHTQLPPLGCLSAFQPLSFSLLKNATEQLRPAESKIWMTAYSKQPLHNINTHTHSALRRQAGRRWPGQREVINECDVTVWLDKLHKDIQCETSPLLSASVKETGSHSGALCTLLHSMTPTFSETTDDNSVYSII